MIPYTFKGAMHTNTRAYEVTTNTLPPDNYLRTMAIYTIAYERRNGYVYNSIPEDDVLRRQRVPTRQHSVDKIATICATRRLVAPESMPWQQIGSRELFPTTRTPYQCLSRLVCKVSVLTGQTHSRWAAKPTAIQQQSWSAEP